MNFIALGLAGDVPHRNAPVAAKNPSIKPRIDRTRNQIAMRLIVVTDRSIDLRQSPSDLRWIGIGFQSLRPQPGLAQRSAFGSFSVPQR